MDVLELGEQVVMGLRAVTDNLFSRAVGVKC